MSNDIGTVPEAVKTAVACTAKSGIGTEDELTAPKVLEDFGFKWF